MYPRSRILLLIPHLGGGGAERVIAQLAQSLPRDSFDVHLGVILKETYSSEALPGVRVHRVGAHRVLAGALGLVQMVRRLQPDLIISAMFHLNFLVLLLRPFFPGKTCVLVRQNGMLASCSNSRVTRELYRATYPRADGIICQTPAMAAEMARLLGSEHGIRVLRNPVDVRGIRRAVERTSQRWEGPGPHLLSIGRLSIEKGFDLLLEAFAAIRGLFPSADLAILGQGAQEQELRALCISRGLASSVRFVGYVTQPASWFRDTAMLVIPSRQDAFPNVLLEGAAAGLPIVAAPCSEAVTELLHGQAGVWLAQNNSSTALANSILAALHSLHPGQRFLHPWVDPFDVFNSIAKYESLIHETLGNPAT